LLTIINQGNLCSVARPGMILRTIRKALCPHQTPFYKLCMIQRRKTRGRS
jgi:hypothetical protein